MSFYYGPRRRQLTPYEQAMNCALLGEKPPGWREVGEQKQREMAEATAAYLDCREERRVKRRRPTHKAIYK